ncbi:hypothetical protein J2S13_002264 [Oikeobacillus pervagus]|uniref:Uncharacterized protein n=1 Tax=Oikeobacillus pervagus TaxID=1325931 RepID=A0AAJ1T4Q8_9BACI|nr:hypothetical protein [Oikeobacillus pervagus]
MFSNETSQKPNAYIMENLNSFGSKSIVDIMKIWRSYSI